MTGADAATRGGDAPLEARIVLQSTLEPIVFRFEADQYAGGPPMPRNDNLPLFRFGQKARQIILDLREPHFFHSGLANRASHESTCDFATSAAPRRATMGDRPSRHQRHDPKVRKSIRVYPDATRFQGLLNFDDGSAHGRNRASNLSTANAAGKAGVCSFEPSF